MIILNSISRVIKNDIKGAVRLMSGVQTQSDTKAIIVQGNTYQTDEWTNVTPRILSLMERRLHLQPNHPIGLIKQRIIDFMYGKYNNVRGNPLFSVHQVSATKHERQSTNFIKIVYYIYLQNLGPIVTTYQNFDTLLVPKDHVSRKKQDSYFINKNIMLRAHTSAHQAGKAILTVIFQCSY